MQWILYILRVGNTEELTKGISRVLTKGNTEELTKGISQDYP